MAEKAKIVAAQAQNKINVKTAEGKRDRSTAELMRHFYEAWVGGASAPSALRIAQRTLAETPRFRKPVHWGAFVIVGV